MKEQIIYYTDELKDEFSEAQITAKEIDESFDYEGGIGRKMGRIFWYHIIAKPFAWIYLKLAFGHRIVNKKVLKQAKGKVYFLYGNHTNAAPDALIPTMLNFNRSVYVIVHPNNVSMPVLGKITPSLGAVPLPDTKGALKNFTKMIEHLVEKNKVVMIYPEAHIWPYYTKIRPFTEESFRYPAQYGTSVFCFTNTYQKRKHRKTPRIVTYVDGPFFADRSLPKKQQKKQLRDQAYQTMVERSKESNIEIIHYIKQENNKN